MIRVHILFSGRVQGVGFRFRANYLAEMLGLTGWVRNCADDRVEMQVQGNRAAIEELIRRLKEQHFIRIDDVDMREIPIEEEASFYVKD